MFVMIVIRDVVYNKATDDFTVSVKDLKRDIVMDGERFVLWSFNFYDRHSKRTKFDYVVVASG